MNLMSGKYTIVTGGGTGIGFGIARRFIESIFCEDAMKLSPIGLKDGISEDCRLLSQGHF